jgi:very-short-patch-repair endonuclease
MLWRQLRAKRFDGLKFRRQHPCGPYFLDFYCARKKIAIELDGGHHASEEQLIYDKIRSEYLQSRGIKVLRFWNNDVLQQTRTVLQAIWDEVC